MRNLLVLLTILCLTSSCKKKYPGHGDPMTHGKCSAYTYVNGRPWEQQCEYAGYYWYCKDTICWRKEPLPSEVLR